MSDNQADAGSAPALEQLRDALLAGPQRLRGLLGSMPAGLGEPWQTLSGMADRSRPGVDPGRLEGWAASEPQPALVVTALSAATVLAEEVDEDGLLRLAGLARAATPNHASPTLLGIAATAEAMVAAVGWNLTAMAEAFEAAIAALPDDSGLRAHLLLELALALAGQGRLQRIALTLDLPPFDADPSLYPQSLAAACFIDAIECGRLRQAEILAGRAGAGADGGLLGTYHDVLALLQQLDLLGVAAPGGDPLLNANALLASRDLARLADTALDPDRTFGHPVGFLSWTGIRVALALGDHAQARMQLERRAHHGYDHPWLTDFMTARLEAAEGRPASAATRMARALHGASAVKARDRLGLELRLAVELEPVDLLLLGQRIDHEPVTVPEQGALDATVVMAESQARAMASEAIGLWVGESTTSAVARNLVAEAAGERRRGGDPWRDRPLCTVGEVGSGRRHLIKLWHRACTNSDQGLVVIDARLFQGSSGREALLGRQRNSGLEAGLLERLGSGTLLLTGLQSAEPWLLVALRMVGEEGVWLPVGSAEAQPFRGRLAVTSTRPLGELVEQGTIDAASRYWLETGVVALPPLRERPADLIPIIDAWFRHHHERTLVFGAQAMERLLTYPWPGNVRELLVFCRRLHERHPWPGVDGDAVSTLLGG